MSVLPCIDVFILIYFFHFYFSFFSLTITRLLLNVKNVTWAVERCHLVFRKKNLVAVVVLAAAQPSCCTRPLALNGLQSLFLQALDSLYTAGGWRRRVARGCHAGGGGRQ